MCVCARVSASVISYIFFVVAVTAVVCFVSDWNSKWPYNDYNKIRKLNLNASNCRPPWKMNCYCRMCALLARRLRFHFHFDFNSLMKQEKTFWGSERWIEMRNKLISTPESNFPMATLRGYRNENGILISNPNASMASFLIFVCPFTSRQNWILILNQYCTNSHSFASHLIAGQKLHNRIFHLWIAISKQTSSLMIVCVICVSQPPYHSYIII